MCLVWACAAKCFLNAQTAPFWLSNVVSFWRSKDRVVLDFHSNIRREKYIVLYFLWYPKTLRIKKSLFLFFGGGGQVGYVRQENGFIIVNTCNDRLMNPRHADTCQMNLSFWTRVTQHVSNANSFAPLITSCVLQISGFQLQNDGMLIVMTMSVIV